MEDHRPEAAVARLHRLFGVLSPRALFHATLALAPEDRRPRRRDVIQLEECALHLLDASGAWKWE